MLLEDLKRLVTTHGLKVAPAQRMSKLPATAHGVYDATDDLEKIAAWHATMGDCNWLISGEGSITLDVDTRNDGHASLLDLEMEHGPLPRTLTTVTPSGGLHLRYKTPEDHPGAPNRAIAPGIDVKSRGGYVISPWSQVENGRYRLEHDVPIADAPDWLVQLCGVFTKRERPVDVNIPDARDDVVARARQWLEGQPRGDEAFKTACGLRDLGLSEAQARELLVEHDGRHPDVIAEKVNHAYRYASGDPGSKVALPEDFPIVNIGLTSQRKTKPAVGPIAFDDFTGQERKSAGYLVKGVLHRQSYAMLYGASGEGKAQPLDEMVLTPDGWKPMGEIRPGMDVIGSAGLPTRVLAVYPQGDKDEWEVEFNNGDRVRCCAEHLWTVYKHGLRAQTLTTAQLATKPRRSEWHVPLPAPVNYRERTDPLPLDPYLLGILIGDGGLTAYAGLTSADAAIVEAVRAALPAGHELRHKGRYAYQIVSPRGQPNFVWTALRILDLAGHKSQDKKIPDEYMRASPGARLALLQGLMDSDGWSQGGQTWWFQSSSRVLAEQVRDLVASLGGVANQIRVKPTVGLDAHLFTFKTGNWQPVRLLRKIERASPGHVTSLGVASVRPTGRRVPMQCIAVAARDHLYVTRGFVLTHNTFGALDLGYHVATGREWMGKRVKQAPVLYVGFEAFGGLANRAKALRQRYDDERVPLYFMPGTFNLREADGRRDFGAALAALPETPGLIVFDTFAYALMGGDENSAQDVGAFNSAVQALIESTGACVMIVHHTGKDATKGARGSSALRAAVDTEIEVAGRAITPTKQREIELIPAIGFKLKAVQIGFDEDGDPITSCVVEPGSARRIDAATTRMREGSTQRLIWDALADARPDNAPITAREWYDACRDFLPESDARASAAFRKARSWMKRTRLILEDEDGLIQRRLE